MNIEFRKTLNEIDQAEKDINELPVDLENKAQEYIKKGKSSPEALSLVLGGDEEPNEERINRFRNTIGL